MRHLILHGEYEISIDDKNRFLIPAEIRKRMDPERDGTAFYLVIGQDRRPWIYTERFYESLSSDLPAELKPGLDRLAFDRLRDHEPPCRPVPRPHPRRRRHDRPRHPRRRHPLVDRRRAADPRLRRDGPADPRES